MIIEKDCDNRKFSSNINEVIRAVLNFFLLLLFFFYKKVLHALKALKPLKALKGTKTLRQKHKNANKRISDYFPRRCYLGAFFIFIRL